MKKIMDLKVRLALSKKVTNRLTIIVFFLIFIFFLPLTSHASDSALHWQDGFENGLDNWGIYTSPGRGKGTVEIVQGNCSEGNKCAKIENINARYYTYISRRFTMKGSGSLMFSGKIRCENITTGRENYHRGKFIAVVLEDGKEVDWYDNDFDGTIKQWISRSVILDSLKKGSIVELRVGVQNTTGITYVDDIKVTFSGK